VSTSLQILLTVALVAGGIAAYHVITDHGEPVAGPEVAVLEGRDLADLEDRLAVLEGRDPMLRGANDTRDLWAYLKRLDERLTALEEHGPAAARAVPSETSPATVDDAGASASEVATGLPGFSDAQEKAIRALVDGAVRERMAPRIEGRVNQTLDRLGIELTPEQRGKLDAAWLEHVEAVREVFRTAQERGADREQVMEDVAAVNAKFTRSLAEFLPAGDAEAIGGALTAVGRGPPGGPGRLIGPR